jgi:pyridoxamine 5'-phosphate oxidase family protein
MFSEKEIAYLDSQRLARIATVSSELQVDVSPVGFDFDGQYFYTYSSIMKKTNRYKNVAAGNTKVSLVVDDLETIDPHTPRGIKIHGIADIVEREGPYGKGLHLRIAPTKSWSYGILEPAFQNGHWTTTKMTW